MMLLSAFVLSLTLADDAVFLSSYETDARKVLEDPKYGFCHDENYPLTEEEARWCPLVATHGASHCPGFAKACEAPRGTTVGSGRWSARTVEDEDPEPAESDDDDASKERGKGEGPRRERDEPPPEEIEIPALGGLAQVLFWIIIAVAIVLVAAAIFRNVVRGDRLDPEADPGDGVDEGDDPEARAAATRAMETDVDRLLALAQRSAEQGAYAEAVDYTHAALLRRLDHEGLIRLHASRTNGEYIRELGSNATLHQPVRDALRRIDRAQFGPGEPERTVYDDVRQRVTSIVKTVGPMAILLAAAFGSTLACDSAAQRDRYPWSTSPSGTDAVFEFLRSQDIEPSYRSEPLTSLQEENAFGDPVIVLLGGAEASDEEWVAVESWVRGGGQLIVAGGEIPPWVNAGYVLYPEPDPDGLEDDVPFAIIPSGPALELPYGQWFGRNDAGNPYVTSYEIGFGAVTLIADDHMFTNAALAFEGNPEMLVLNLESLDANRVEFVDAWASKGADTPADSISHTHLTAAIVQLLLLIVALYLWRGARFGRGRDPVRQSRRAFVQHAVAMGRQYEKARAATFAAGLFSAWVLERLRNRFSSAATAGLLGLAQEVARVSGRDETDVMRLLVAAHGAVESRLSPGGTGEDLALIRDLGRLMRDIGETT
jgi:hypothetical protein